MPDLSPIEAHERTIGRIFSDEYAFEIPPYQRPYAWEIDQARELLSDLIDAMENGDPGNVYFLGSVVLIKKPGAPEAKVVDGQQRLTTLTIMLSVMRDLTSDIEIKLERRAYVHQKASADKGTTDRYRLLLRERDRPFFQKHVQTMEGTTTVPPANSVDGSLQRIAENTAFYRSEFAKFSEERRNRIFAFVIQRCYLVVVAVPTQDSARRIFTVLNARGLDLMPTDILKADLLERAGAAKEPELARRWEEIELAIGRDRFVELFGHIRMIFEREKPRSALDVGFPRLVPPFKGDADAFLTNVLEPIASAAELLAKPSSFHAKFGPEAAKALRSLHRIDNKDWLPPILLRIWRSTSSDGASIAQFTADLERLSYFLFVTRADVNERIARFAGVMDAIDSRQARSVAAAGLTLTAEEQVSFMSALGSPLYRKSRVCKPVLQRLDEALSSGGATYEEPTSIEHVLPQTIDNKSEWAALYPSAEIRTFWSHRLANLVLLTKRINTRASNWDFNRKKAEYFASKDGISPFPLTQSVLKTKHWTVDHLIERQSFLLEKLAGIWRITLPFGWNNELYEISAAPAPNADGEEPQSDLPTYKEIESALLLYLRKTGPIEPAEVYKPLADLFNLTVDQRTSTRPDNSTPIWNNRVQWARKALKDKGYLSTQLGIWSLSDVGSKAADAQIAMP